MSELYRDSGLDKARTTLGALARLMSELGIAESDYLLLTNIGLLEEYRSQYGTLTENHRYAISLVIPNMDKYIPVRHLLVERLSYLVDDSGADNLDNGADDIQRFPPRNTLETRRIPQSQKYVTWLSLDLIFIP